MNIPKYALDNKKVVYFILAMLLIGGAISFFELPKKEDSPFSIKTAVLITQYPGAKPEEVEKLITEPIEREIQSMSEVNKIESESRFGISKIEIELLPTIDPSRMPVKWDELRRKVANIQAQLPQGASPVIVNDDFGDVYGIYYALTMEKGFSYRELRDVAQQIKTELTPIKGVQKVQLFGEQVEVVNIFFDIPTMANLGIDPNSIMGIMQAQNLLVNSGELNAGQYQVKVNVDGTYKSLNDIRNQIILSKTGMEVRIGDIATVETGYMDPPSTLMRVNGKAAIGIGVATGAKDDVVSVGDMVAASLANFEGKLPMGMHIETIYPENTIAREANNGFIINLIESLLIVIAIIFLVMGARAGILIGSSLLFSVGGTLLIMLVMGVGLNRTSLAAFIIAMGMLVDNAIVVTDNAQIGIKRGLARRKALIDGAIGPQWGLLGATFIAVCSFLPLFLAPASVAEIVKPLFIVLAISLGLSWILALSQTPVFGNFILKENSGGKITDPYDTKLYHKFERVLARLIKRRFVTLTSVVIFLFVSLWVMGLMPQSFFPSMNKPYMRADLIFPDGYSIRDVEKNSYKIEAFLNSDKRIKSYSITMGGSPIRYYLASASFGPLPNYANVLIEVSDSKFTANVEEEFYQYMKSEYPDVITRSSLFMLSPVPEAKIEIGFIGNNIDTLTALANQAMALANKNKMVMDVRNGWGNKVPVMNPLYSQEKGLRLGITRQQFAYALKAATTGIPLGEYREGDVIMPILLKDAGIDSLSANDIRTLPIYSSKSMQVSVDQVSDNYVVDYEYSVIKRYNRERVMLMSCEPRRDVNAIEAFKSIYHQMQDSITVPAGYKLIYLGDQEQQDTSNNALAENIPITFLIIYFVLLLLFPKAYKKPLVIMAMLPLIFIGVVWGLLLFGKSLDFFAILGLLGLIGMNIKNAIVLVDQIGIETDSGLDPLNAVIQATKTRIVPVTMASGTTILGMLPLLFDAMFAGMAATIMGGLLMATILTIFVLPVTYCILFKIRSDK
ncbi:MAG: efflux RND transporter permease subunit [Bacteroidales bacterium]